MRDTHFESILTRRLSRRAVLGSGFNAAASVSVLSSLGGLLGCSDDRSAASGHSPVFSAPALGFAAVAKNLSDKVTVPEGYTARVLYATGDPIKAGIAAYLNDGTDADMDKRAGDHHDALYFFGLNAVGDHDPRASDRGLLLMNHENLNQYYLHPNGPTYDPVPAGTSFSADTTRTVPDEVRKEINAHGVAVVEVQNASGSWATVQASPFNRRITPYTPMQFGGPAAGSDLLKTKYDPQGLTTRGTINNCANGYTPWGTYLTCEENWAGYFRKTSNTDLSASQVASNTRYSVANYGGSERKFWANATGGSNDEFARFNANATAGGSDVTQDYRQEPNGFGWVVEIDPFDPTSTPRKRTAMGRFAHEGCWVAPLMPGRPVVFYMGDDARNEYIYKFVSDENYNPSDRGLDAGDKYLDNGTLYVARFDADGTGDWIALVHNSNGLNAAAAPFAFPSQASVLVNARLAADEVGATKMDRPEWGAVNPLNGEVYFTLTNNRVSNRPVASLDAANPRAYEDAPNSAGNVNGHIIRWREDGSDPTSTTFVWDVYLFGAQHDSPDATVDLSGLTAENDFSSPDGLWFDDRGLLWIQTDDGAYTDVTNCMMLAATPGKVGDGGARSVTSTVGANSKTVTTYVGRAASVTNVRRFLVGPKQCEITGVCMTPDFKAMFINIQHPGEAIDNGLPAAVAGDGSNYGSHWPLNYPAATDAEADANGGAGGAGARPRSATIVITRDDNGEIGI